MRPPDFIEILLTILHERKMDQFIIYSNPLLITSETHLPLNVCVALQVKAEIDLKAEDGFHHKLTGETPESRNNTPGGSHASASVPCSHSVRLTLQLFQDFCVIN